MTVVLLPLLPRGPAVSQVLGRTQMAEDRKVRRTGACIPVYGDFRPCPGSPVGLHRDAQHICSARSAGVHPASGDNAVRSIMSAVPSALGLAATQIKAVLGAASLAPSVHNTQPWR